MKGRRVLLVFFLVIAVVGVCYVSCDGVEIINKIRFPYGPNIAPYMGMFVAIAFPLDIRGPADVFFSMNFESSYTLPSNQTTLVYPPIISSTSTREFLYKFLEDKIKSYGYPGKGCLLRAVCEASEYTTKNIGILGDIVHILLTPSTSIKETNLTDYVKSEEYGRNKGHCNKYIKGCKLSILNLVSRVTNKLKV